VSGPQHAENMHCCWLDQVTKAGCDQVPLYIIYSDSDGDPCVYYHACRYHLTWFLQPCRNVVYLIQHPPMPWTVRMIEEP
jgi:hypothetical protein